MQFAGMLLLNIIECFQVQTCQFQSANHSSLLGAGSHFHVCVYPLNLMLSCVFRVRVTLLF